MSDASDRTDAAIAVFDPSPLLTVTVEPAEEDGDEIHIHAGGQGFWVARMAVLLGARALLCAPLGGEPGQVLRRLIETAGVSLQSVPSHGANGAYIHDRRSGEPKELAGTASASLTRHEVDELYGVTLTAGLEAGVLVLTGLRTSRWSQPMSTGAYRPTSHVTVQPSWRTCRGRRLRWPSKAASNCSRSAMSS